MKIRKKLLRHIISLAKNIHYSTKNPYANKSAIIWNETIIDNYGMKAEEYGIDINKIIKRFARKIEIE